MQKQLLCPRKPLRFVSLRRRELKFNWLIKTATKLLCSSPCGDVNWNPQFGMIPNINNGSSPCGDVSWNTKTLTADQAKERSSPYGDVNWNRASSCACMSRNTIRLLVGMWVEICWRYIWTRYQNVRLRKGDVSWNVNTTNPSIPRFMFVSSLRRELK